MCYHWATPLALFLNSCLFKELVRNGPILWLHHELAAEEGFPRPGSSSNRLSFSASSWMIRQFPHCLPFSIGTVLLCSGRLCSTGTAFSLASKMFNLLLDILTEYSLLNACQEFCLLFLLYFFLVLKYCFKSPWQNSPLKPSGCPFLVLLPRTCCSSVGCPGLGLASAFLCSEVFPFFFFYEFMAKWEKPGQYL